MSKYTIDYGYTGLMDDYNCCLEFNTFGDTREEMVENGIFWRMDSDGGERGEILLVDCGGREYDVGLAMIDECIACTDALAVLDKIDPMYRQGPELAKWLYCLADRIIRPGSYTQSGRCANAEVAKDLLAWLEELRQSRRT